MDILYVAVARLQMEDGKPTPGMHLLIASAGDQQKQWKKSIMDIMDQGGEKLLKLSTKMIIKMADADKQYEYWASCEDLDGMVLAFFAVTNIMKSKDKGEKDSSHISTKQRINDFKEAFLRENNRADLQNAKEKGGVHKANVAMLSGFLGGGNSKLANVQAKVNAVKGNMEDNINTILSAQENLEGLEGKVADLQDGSKQFAKGARAVHRQMWWDNLRMKIMIGVVILVIVLILIIVLAVAFG